MYLTASNVYYYLRDSELISPAQILDGGIIIVEVGRRNRNFRIEIPAGSSLFVKQVPAFIPETTLSFMREAACAQLAAESETLTTLRAVMPVLRRYDPLRHILIHGLFQQCESYADAVRKAGIVPDALTEALALVLAGVHRETMRPGALEKAGNAFAGEAPWIFIIGEKAEMVMPNMSPGCRQVVDLLRATPELYHGLAQLGQQWRRIGLMHGDLKWDNVMITGLPDGSRALKLIDWELANLGDPLWDVAGALGALIQCWLLSQPDETQPPAIQPRPPSAPPIQIGMIRRSAAKFWRTYAGALQSGFPIDEKTVLHAGQLTGARLVLLAFELLANASSITFYASGALHLARYFFADPRRALSDLLGIEPMPGGGYTPIKASGQTPWALPPEVRQ